jgi:hypothetical protein
LIAAEPGEAIGKGDDDRWHAPFTDQPIEPLRQVLPETDPIRLRQAAAREADKIHEQGKSLAVVPSREVDIDDARRRMALDGETADGTYRPGKLAHAPYPNCPH